MNVSTLSANELVHATNLLESPTKLEQELCKKVAELSDELCRIEGVFYTLYQIVDKETEK